MILKLQLGQENAISGNVVAVTMEKGQFGEQYKFAFDNGDALYLNKDVVDRQAARLELLPNEIIGEFTFWKKPMPNDPTGTKGYLNIERGLRQGGARVSATRNAVDADDYVGRDLRNAGVKLPATTFEQLKDKYMECLGASISILSDCTETYAQVFTPAEITSVAATLFIERNKRGI